MKPSGILNFENVPQDAGDPDVKVYVNGELVETGGGGKSDFTVANVSIGADTMIQLCVLTDPSELYSLPAGTLPTVITDYVDAEEGTYSVPLYKGHAIIICLRESLDDVETSGDIEHINEPGSDAFLFDVTGDCSVTYTGE